MTDKVRIGILGTANIAEQIAKAAKLSNKVIINAIAGRNLDKSKQWADKFQIPNFFGSYEDLLKSDTIDAIYLPLPNSLHAEWTIKCLEAGYNVLCEKPITTNTDDTEKVMEKSTATKLSVVEGFMYWHHPMYEEIKQIIGSGEIGSISSLNSCFSWYCDDRTETPASAELGGGALFDVGCYPVHFSRNILGMEPERVFAFEKRSNVDDTMVGALEFADGTLAQFETSIANFERQQAEIVGTKGNIVIENPWVSAGKTTKLTINKEYAEPRTITFDVINTYQLELDHFADIVKSKKLCTTYMVDSIKNMKVIDALFTSAKTGAATAVK